jgi:hypothetical protein
MNLQDFQYWDNKLESLYSDFEQLINDNESAAKERQARISHKAAEVAACLHGMRRAMQQPMPFDEYVSPLRYRNNGMREKFAMIEGGFVLRPARLETCRHDDAKDAQLWCASAILERFDLRNGQSWKEFRSEVEQQPKQLSTEEKIEQMKATAYRKPNQSEAFYNELARLEDLALTERLKESAARAAASYKQAKATQGARLGLFALGELCEALAKHKKGNESVEETMRRLRVLNHRPPTWEELHSNYLREQGIEDVYFFGPTDNRLCVYYTGNMLTPVNLWRIDMESYGGSAYAWATATGAPAGLWFFAGSSAPVFGEGLPITAEATFYIRKQPLPAAAWDEITALVKRNQNTSK